jgi:hypothetical protein
MVGRMRRTFDKIIELGSQDSLEQTTVSVR